jgi:hypothetical protein
LFFPAPLMGAGWGGGDVVGSAARELSSRLGRRDFAGRRGCRIAPQAPHSNPYRVDTSHSRPCFDSKWNRQRVSWIRFGIETHDFSQLSDRELAPIEVCPLDRGRGGGEPLPSRARNPVSIVPCFCRKSAGPHPNPPPRKGAGIESACRESSPAPSMGAGRGGGEPLPSRARNPLSILPCFCRKSAGQPGRHRSLN